MLPSQCCDTCSPGTPPQPDFLVMPTVQRKPKPRPVRIVNNVKSELKRCLLEERNRIIEADVGYRMLPKEVVLPTGSIERFCKQARYIQSIQDINSIPGLDHDLFQSRLYGVFMDVFHYLFVCVLCLK